MKKIFITMIIVSFFVGLNGAFLAIYLFGNNEIINTNQTQGINEKIQFVNITSIENEITKIARELSPGVVSIIIKKDLLLYKNNPGGFFNTPIGTVKQKVGGGTGFFVTQDGTIITNKHVISDMSAEYSVITSNGNEYNARVLAIDPLTDLAIIKIESDEQFKVLDIIEDEKHINIGQFGIAIGNALAEFQNTVSLGVISGKNRSIEPIGGGKLTGLLQTDAAINPGNSGGPLVNLDGKVMGINTAIVGGSNSLGFTIPLSKKKIEYFLESIEKYSEIKKPFIGINYIIVNEQLMQKLGLNYNYGAYIFNEEGSVVPGSQAEISGIEQGDLILEVDGIKISALNDLNSIIQNKIPGDEIELIIIKEDGIQKTIKLELGTN